MPSSQLTGLAGLDLRVARDQKRASTAGPGVAPADAAIVAEGLEKHFSGVRAVNGIDLAIPYGQIFGFLGANGSGKTTTIRMLTTLLRPTAGRASVAGLDVRREARAVRRQIGVALQEAGLDDLQTGRELLRLQARLYDVPRGQIESRIAELLGVVDLEGDADRRIGTCSGGMQRRLDLVSALVHQPRILFLDEPTSGLDPVGRETLWRYLERLNHEDGVTIFLTTQYLEEADRLADDVAILDAGRVVAQGSPAELKASIATDVVVAEISGGERETLRAIEALWLTPGVEDIRADANRVSVYVRQGSRAIPGIVRLLDEAQLSFGELTLSRPTLDDVFLRVTGHHLEPAGEEPAAGRTGAGR